MASRKELVESGLSKLANGNEDERFLARRDFDKAIQTKNDNSYSDGQIEFFIMMIKLLNKNHNAISDYKSYLGQGIFIEGPTSKSSDLLEDLISKETNITRITDWEFNGYMDNAMKNLPNLWLKSVKFDAFLAKYKKFREQADIGKQEILQFEEMFQSFEN